MVQASLSPAVPKPDHVPDALVYDYDHYYDPGLRKDAHARILEIAKEAPPIFWTPRHGGHWILRGHSAVYNASRAPDVFSNAPMPYEMLAHMNANLPDEKKILIPLPITVDPPHHTYYRGPLQKPFSPKAMLGLKDSIRKLAAELVERVKPDGGCEFMTAIAEPLPVTIFLELFGLPVEKGRVYRDLVAEHLHSPIGDAQATQARLRKVADAMNETILDRRDNPKEDIISMLWQSEYNGKPATLHDIENYAVMLFIAGLDTVMNGMGLGVRHLAMHPELQKQLRENLALVPEAGEELLRRYTFTVPPRFLLDDVEFEGVQMKKGERAFLFLPAADLDPSEFADPAAYNLARENKVHIAFGTGPHRCLGSHLARIELQVLYEEMLKLLPEFRLDPTKEVSFHGGHVIGPDELHLVLGTSDLGLETLASPAWDKDNRAFWTGGAEGKLNIAKCGDCGGFIHPPREVCRHCLSENVAPHAVSGTGVVDTYTVNHQAWAKDMEVPFVIARVKLDDAPEVYLTTNIVNCPVDAVEIDDRVRVVFEEQDGVWFPLFEKVG